MTKKELVENYTMEQLAEMVVKYQNASEVKNDEIQKLKWDISNLEESNGRLQTRVDTYTNYLLPRCTKEAKELIDHNHFVGVRIVAIDNEKKCDCGKEDEINCLKTELHRKETTINQIDEILNKMFGVTHDIVKTPDEFERILAENADGYKAISDFLPTEPIKVADMLINASRKRINCMTEKEYETEIFDKMQLQQIARHLLVYCNVS